MVLTSQEPLRDAAWVSSSTSLDLSSSPFHLNPCLLFFIPRYHLPLPWCCSDCASPFEHHGGGGKGRDAEANPPPCLSAIMAPWHEPLLLTCGGRREAAWPSPGLSRRRRPEPPPLASRGYRRYPRLRLRLPTAPPSLPRQQALRGERIEGGGATRGGEERTREAAQLDWPRREQKRRQRIGEEGEEAGIAGV